MLLENNPYPGDVRVRAEALSLVAAGHEVTVVAPRAAGEPASEHVEGVNVIRFRAFEGSQRGAIGYVIEYLLAALALHMAAVRQLLRGATVLHIHNPPDMMFPAGALYRLAGRKVIFDHHDLFPETIEVKFGSRAAKRVALVCERLTHAVANRVIATNQSYAEIACERGGKSPDDVMVVRNAPPASWMEVRREPRRGALPDLQLAYVGAISSQDGAEGLAAVLAGLRDEHGLNAHLTIIGDGDARPALEAELSRHGVVDAVSFTGWVALAQVPELIAAADVCVDPAPATFVNEHSTMMKVAEYLALGKPVVAYDLLETRRTADGAAELVPPGDAAAFSRALARIAGDEELRMRMQHAAHARARQLVWEHSERALLETYERLRAA
jgi:glycosyltransferase involved in cell wall biosynthesis